MKKICMFLNTHAMLTAFIGGSMLGLIYWYFIGCYWGSYPLSSEWWVNCIYGGIFANVLISIKRDILT